MVLSIDRAFLGKNQTKYFIGHFKFDKSFFFMENFPLKFEMKVSVFQFFETHSKQRSIRKTKNITQKNASVPLLTVRDTF